MKHRVISKHGTKIRDLNPRRAIRHFCLACSDFEWGKVISCSNQECRLYKFRLGNLKESEMTSQDRSRSIQAYCQECSEYNGVEREQCDAVFCALYPFRNNQKQLRKN